MAEPDFRALCAELLQPLAEYDSANPYHEHRDLITRARAALAQPETVGLTDGTRTWLPAATLAQPEPEGPTLDDIVDLCADHEFMLGVEGANEEESAQGLLEIARAVLARWGRPAPQPIPVAKRLPGEGDCNAEGRCWIHQPHPLAPEAPEWKLARVKYASSNYDTTHWLPHWALPLPQEANQ